jgi:hypothetical protein
MTTFWGDTGDTGTANPFSAKVLAVSLSITCPKTESDTGDTYIKIIFVGIQ